WPEYGSTNDRVNDMKTALQKTSLSKLARQINAAHEKAEGSLRSCLQHAKEAGDLLLEAKQQVEHGHWLPWLRDNCTMPARTAQAYMRVSKLWPELEAKCASLAHLSFEGAVKFLAAPKSEPPEPEPDPVLVPFESALADFRRFLASVNDED